MFLLFIAIGAFIALVGYLYSTAGPTRPDDGSESPSVGVPRTTALVEARNSLAALLRKEHAFEPVDVWLEPFTRVGVSVDREGLRVALLDATDGKPRVDIIAGTQILDAEIVRDARIATRSHNWLGRTAVGGLIAGEAGAVVGAVTSGAVQEHHVRSIVLSIRVDDIPAPVRQIPFVVSPSGKHLTPEQVFSMQAVSLGTLECSPDTWRERIRLVRERAHKLLAGAAVAALPPATQPEPAPPLIAADDKPSSGVPVLPATTSTGVTDDFTRCMING